MGAPRGFPKSSDTWSESHRGGGGSKKKSRKKPSGRWTDDQWATRRAQQAAADEAFIQMVEGAPLTTASLRTLVDEGIVQRAYESAVERGERWPPERRVLAAAWELSRRRQARTERRAAPKRDHHVIGASGCSCGGGC